MFDGPSGVPPIKVTGDDVPVEFQAKTIPSRDSLAGKSRAGWTPALDDAQRLPVRCPNCGTIFPSQICFLHGRHIGIWNSTETCVKCGYDYAEVSEGVFNFTNELVELISGPQVTQKILKDFYDIIREAAAGRLSKKEAVKKARAINPRVGRIVARAFGIGLPAIGLVYTALAYHLQLSDSQKADAFNEQLSEMLARQTYAVERIAGKLRDPKNEDRIESNSSDPTEKKADLEAIRKKKTPRDPRAMKGHP